MIRGVDNKGCVILGITRGEVEGLLDGKRCCFITKEPEAPGPHICLWFAETDDDLIAKLGQMYPEGIPAEIKDYRTRVT
jgi:hypothetical protein